MSRKTLIFTLFNSFVWSSCIGAAMAQGHRGADTPPTTYLALGDSLPFGYNPLIQPPSLTSYYGYPSFISSFTRDTLANGSCPFETTATFLSGGTTADGVFGCPVWRAGSHLANPLFMPYSGAQVDAAASYLQTHSNTQLVTLQLGGNDLADLELDCKGDTVCETANLPVAMGQVAQNLGTAVARIRATGYTGPIVLVNYYAFNYTDARQTGGFGALAQAIAAVAAASPNVKVADAFKAFALASSASNGDTCAAGLRIKLNTLNPQTGDTCDVHPSLTGQAVLAGSVAMALR
jgi:lysophospholipase L1-like esterase